MCVCQLTVFDLAQALISDELLFLEVSYQGYEWIQSISELTCDGKDLLGNCTSVTLADGVGGKAHKLTCEIREPEEVAMVGYSEYDRVFGCTCRRCWACSCVGRD